MPRAGVLLRHARLCGACLWLTEAGCLPRPALPAGLIGTSVHMPAADPASPRITKPQPAAQPAPAASPFNWPSLTGQQAAAASEQQQQAAQQAAQQAPAHIRSDTVVVVPADGAPVAAVPLPAAPAVQRGRSSDYLAALDSAATNPFETPALRQQQEEEGGLAGAFGGAAGAAGAAAPSTAAAVGGAAAPAAAAAAKAAEKQELLQQVQVSAVPRACSNTCCGSAALPAQVPCMYARLFALQTSRKRPCPTAGGACHTCPVCVRVSCRFQSGTHPNECRGRSMATRSSTQSGPPCWGTWTRACRWVGCATPPHPAPCLLSAGRGGACVAVPACLPLDCGQRHRERDVGGGGEWPCGRANMCLTAHSSTALSSTLHHPPCTHLHCRPTSLPLLPHRPLGGGRCRPANAPSPSDLSSWPQPASPPMPRLTKRNTMWSRSGGGGWGDGGEV